MPHRSDTDSARLRPGHAAALPITREDSGQRCRGSAVAAMAGRGTMPPVAELPLPDHIDGDPNDRLVFRRGKLRKREDDEVRMLREALENLVDVPRVKRILLELSRFYNPVTNKPVMSLETRRRVAGLLEAGDPDAAKVLLDAHLAEYLKMDDRRSGGGSS